MCEQEPTYSDLRHDVEDAMNVFPSNLESLPTFPTALGVALHNILDEMGELQSEVGCLKAQVKKIQELISTFQFDED